MPRFVHPNVTAYRESGRMMVQRHLIWVTAREYGSEDPVSIGFWDDRRARELPVYDPVNGAAIARTYHAGGSVIEVEEIAHNRGTDIHPAYVTLAPTSAEVDGVLRGYRLRGAPVELHRIWFDHATREPLAPAHVWFTGTLGKAPLTTPPAGGSGRLRFTIVPPTRALSFGNPEILSDTVQSQRAGDRIFRHIATAGSRDIPWMRNP